MVLVVLVLLVVLVVLVLLVLLVVLVVLMLLLVLLVLIRSFKCAGCLSVWLDGGEFAVSAFTGACSAVFTGAMGVFVGLKKPDLGIRMQMMGVASAGALTLR